MKEPWAKYENFLHNPLNFESLLLFLQQRSNVGGISHVGIARCAGRRNDHLLLFYLYELHHVEQFSIGHFAFELYVLSLPSNSIHTEHVVMVSPLFGSY
jgi:hypothetical protein